MPTNSDYLALMGAVYSSGEPKAVSGWTIIASETDSDTKMKAAAYQNNTTGEVVIAYEGTNFGSTDVVDQLESDAAIAGATSPEANTAALIFAESVVDGLAPGTSVYVAGHSLGGEEAEYVYEYSDTAGLGITGGMTIGAPGMPSATNSYSSDTNMKNYLDWGDQIGNFVPSGGSHVGSVIYVGNQSDLVDEITLPALGGGLGAGIAGYIAFSDHMLANYQAKILGSSALNADGSQLYNPDPIETVNVSAEWLSPAADPVYDENGYDQNGFDASGYNVFGRNKDGVLDSSIGGSGAVNTDVLSDGTTVEATIASDGSATVVETSPDTSTTTLSIDASGNLSQMHSSSSNGASIDNTVDPTTGNGRQTQVFSNGDLELASYQTNADGSRQEMATLYNAVGQVIAYNDASVAEDGSVNDRQVGDSDGRSLAQNLTSFDSDGDPTTEPDGLNDDENGVTSGSDVSDGMIKGVTSNDSQNFFDGPNESDGGDDDAGDPDPGPFSNPISDAGPDEAGDPIDDGERDPLVINLSSTNGLHLEARSAFTPYFNFDGGDFAHNTAWIGSGSAFLVSPGSGGTVNGTNLVTSFDQLAALDSNSDGVINASDSGFSGLAIWQDLNNDGVAESNEILTLAQAGIGSISLTTTNSGATVNGSKVVETATVTMVDDSTREIAAVDLAVSNYYTQYVGTYSLDSTITALPDLKGYGTLPNLRIAMSTDSTLESLVETLVATDSTDMAAFDAAFQSVLFQWAGVSDEDPTDGNLFDGQKLDFMRAYLGQSISFGTTQSSENPWFPGQAILMQQAWDDIYTSLKARALLQMPDSPFAADFTLDTNTDLILPSSSITDAASFDDGFVASIGDLTSLAPTDASENLDFWTNALTIITASLKDVAQYVSLDTATIVTALQDAAPSTISTQVLEAVVNGTLNVAEGSSLSGLAGTRGSDLGLLTQDNSSFTGFGGGDEIVVNSGLGNTEINEVDNAASPNNVLLLHNVDPADVSVTSDAAGDIILTTTDGDQIKIDQMLSGPATGEELADGHEVIFFNPDTKFGVQKVVFDDGTSWDVAELVSKELAAATSGADVLVGSTAGETFDGAGGSDKEVGNGGGDIFVFDAGYGHLEINEADSNSGANNVLQLGSGIAPDDVSVTGDEDGNIILSTGGTGDQITIDGMLNHTLDGASLGVQSVVFVDGTVWTANTVLAKRSDDSSDVVKVFGTSSSDDFSAPTGDTYEQGGGGNDTFEFSAGSGQLEIDEVDTAATPDNTLQLAEGISTADVIVRGNADGGIVLTDGTSGDEIVLDGMLKGSSYGVQEVTFSDDTVWSASDLISKALIGTSGNDSLYGTSGADTFDGDGGSDYEQGAGGGDTFVYNTGYGNLEIAESDVASTPDNVLSLGEGILPSDVSVSSDSAGNIILSFSGSADQVKIDGMLNSSAQGVQSLVFADSTTWSRTDILARAGQGTSGADQIYGTPGADTIDGDGGSDLVTGEGGNDTFVFNSGYGHLEIDEQDGSSAANNVLSLGAGISASDLSVKANAFGDLIITDGVSGDQITIDGMLQSSSYAGEAGTQYGVQYVDFADGASLAALQLVDMATTGTSGDDELYGTGGPDVFDGKGGNDYEAGNAGNDKFIYNAGYGHLEIYEADIFHDSTTTLELGPDIDPDDVTVTSDAAGAIYLRDGVSGDQIKLDDMEGDSEFGVTTIAFSDSTTWSRSTVDAKAMTGTTGNDTIYGTSGADTLDGMGGTDYISGQGGADTFVFNSGYGHLEIYEADLTGSADTTLQLGAGISTSDVLVSSDASGDVILTIGSSGDQIKLDDMEGDSEFGVSSIVFADSTTWSRSTVDEMACTVGTTGSDSIFGTSGADTFDGKGGSDTITGEGGADTFIYQSGYGHLEINELDTSRSAASVLELGAGIDPGDIVVTSDASGNIYLTDGVSGDQIKLDDMEGDTRYGVTTIAFADSTTWSRSDVDTKAMTGTTGNDTIYGTSGADTLDGKGGTDTITGNGGADTFVYNSGYGHLEINELDTSRSAASVLEFGSGITPGDITVTSDLSDNVYLTDGVSGDQVKLDNMEGNTEYGVSTISFAGGTTWSRSDVDTLAETIAGTTGNDTLTGTSGADTFDGKGGSDSITGDGGADTFIYKSGYGHLEINELDTSRSAASVLELGTGIAPGDVAVSSDASGNIYLTDGVSGDQVKLDDMEGDTRYGVTTVSFSDSTTWSRSTMDAKAMTGTTGNDTIYGTSGADTLDGNGGTDTITGNGGADTFVYNSGYGHLEINELDTSRSAASVLELGAGIDPGDIAVTSDASGNIYLTDGVSGDQIKLDDMEGDTRYGVTTIAFADSTTWSRSDVDTKAMTGTTGNDTIYGTSAADTLDGKGGTDTITGGGGADHYDFNSGYGSLTINNIGGFSAHGELDLGSGIDDEDLWFRHSGDDLIINRIDSSDQVKVSNWFGGNAGYQLGEIKLSDGTELDSQLNSLISAMATFANDNPGFDPATATSMPADSGVQTAIAAAWHS